MLTLEERIARLEKQTHVVEVHADSNSAALADIPDEVWVRLGLGLEPETQPPRTLHVPGLI